MWAYFLWGGKRRLFHTLLTVLILNVTQIEYLQETNRTLEQKVEGLQQKKKNASTEVANLSLKNLELCEELTHIDDLAKRMEMDKERVLETVDMELQDTKVRIIQFRDKKKTNTNVLMCLQASSVTCELE